MTWAFALGAGGLFAGLTLGYRVWTDRRDRKSDLMQMLNEAETCLSGLGDTISIEKRAMQSLLSLQGLATSGVRDQSDAKHDAWMNEFLVLSALQRDFRSRAKSPVPLRLEKVRVEADRLLRAARKLRDTVSASSAERERTRELEVSRRDAARPHRPKG